MTCMSCLGPSDLVDALLGSIGLRVVPSHSCIAECTFIHPTPKPFALNPKSSVQDTSSVSGLPESRGAKNPDCPDKALFALRRRVWSVGGSRARDFLTTHPKHGLGAKEKTLDSVLKHARLAETDTRDQARETAEASHKAV